MTLPLRTAQQAHSVRYLKTSSLCLGSLYRGNPSFGGLYLDPSSGQFYELNSIIMSVHENFFRTPDQQVAFRCTHPGTTNAGPFWEPAEFSTSIPGDTIVDTNSDDGAGGHIIWTCEALPNDYCSYKPGSAISGRNGAAASINPCLDDLQDRVTLTGLSGMAASDVDLFIELKNADVRHSYTCQILTYRSPTSVDVKLWGNTGVADTHNPNVQWQIYDKIPNTYVAGDEVITPGDCRHVSTCVVGGATSGDGACILANYAPMLYGRPIGSGAGASVIPPSGNGFATVSGLSGMSKANIRQILSLRSNVDPANQIDGVITEVHKPSEVRIFSYQSHAVAPDLHNPSIKWTLYDQTDIAPRVTDGNITWEMYFPSEFLTPCRGSTGHQLLCSRFYRMRDFRSGRWRHSPIRRF